MEVDISRIGSERLLADIRRDYEGQDNWFMNALDSCRVYGDSRGLAQPILLEAKRIREIGPYSLGGARLRMIESNIRRHQGKAIRLSAGATGSAQLGVLARMRGDQLVSSSIFAWYSLRGRWINSLPNILSTLANDSSDIYILWLKYCDAPSPTDALQPACAIAELVLGLIAERLKAGPD